MRTLNCLSGKWNEFLNLDRKRDVALANMGEVALAVVSKGETVSVAEKGVGMLAVKTEDPAVAPSEHPPSSATYVELSDAGPVALAPPVKVEVFMQEPDGHGDSSPSTSTQPGTGDVSPNSEGTLLNQMQNLFQQNMATINQNMAKNNQQNMATMNKVVQLNTAETTLAITKIENSIMKSMSRNNDLVNDNMSKLDVKLDTKFSCPA